MDIDPRVEFLNHWYERKFIHGEETDERVLENPWIYDKNGFEKELHEVINDEVTRGKNIEFLNEIVAYHIKKRENELHQRALQIDSNKKLQKLIETAPAENIPEIINSVLKETEVPQIDAFSAETSRQANDKDEVFWGISRSSQYIITISPDFEAAVENTDTSELMKELEELDEQVANIDDITIKEQDFIYPTREDLLLEELGELPPADKSELDELQKIIKSNRYSGPKKSKDQQHCPIIEKSPAQEILSNPAEVIPQSEEVVQPPREMAQSYVGPKTVPLFRKVKKPVNLYYQTTLGLPKVVITACMNMQNEKYKSGSMLNSELSRILIEENKRTVETEVQDQSSTGLTSFSSTSLHNLQPSYPSAQTQNINSRSTLMPIEGEIYDPISSTQTIQRKSLSQNEILDILNSLSDEESSEKDAVTSQLPSTVTATVTNEIPNEVLPQNEDSINQTRQHTVDKNKRRRKRIQRKSLSQNEILDILNSLSDEENNEKDTATSQLPPTVTATVTNEIPNEVLPENEDPINQTRQHTVDKNKKRKRSRPSKF